MMYREIRYRSLCVEVCKVVRYVMEDVAVAPGPLTRPATGHVLEEIDRRPVRTDHRVVYDRSKAAVGDEKGVIHIMEQVAHRRYVGSYTCVLACAYGM